MIRKVKMNKRLYDVTYERRLENDKNSHFKDGHRIFFGRKIIRAKSFKEAREKIRTKFKYDIFNIKVSEVKKSWIRNLLRF